MFERAPNGYFVRDLMVFNHLRRGGYVAKGFVFEAPDLTNSPIADLNDFQEQLCLLLASLHENQRLQVQYFCDSDYKGELLRYQQETERFSNVWTKRARNERVSRSGRFRHAEIAANCLSSAFSQALTIIEPARLDSCFLR